MKAFKFRLAKLQKLTELNTRRAASAFSQARHALQEIQETRRSLEDERNRRGRACPEVGGRVQVEVLASLQKHLGRLNSDLGRALAAEQTHSRRVAARRQTFVETRREQRKFELLRQRQFDAWKLEANRRVQKELDEVAGRCHKPSAHPQAADIAETDGKPRRNA